MEPLNDTLYRALEQIFRRVRICNEGDERQVMYLPEYSSGQVRIRAHSTGSSEEYVIDCPFCNDGRGRFYVNHAWGVFDPTTRSSNYHLIHCFNEQCHLKPENREHFRNMIEFPGLYKPAVVKLRKPAQPQPPEPAHFQLPTGLVPVNHLPPNHPAARYLMDRGFDLAELVERSQISYCEAAPTSQPAVYQRIVIPIYRLPLLQSSSNADKVELAGWQARVVGDPAPGVPKYLFCTGLRKAKLFYGLPQAVKTTGPVVVCEGPTDVWRFGSNAVALFGKSMSDEQWRLLLRHFEGRPIVIALDNDAADEADEIATRLQTARWGRPGDSRVLQLKLPDGGKDPADLSKEVLSDAVNHLLSGTAATVAQPVGRLSKR